MKTVFDTDINRLYLMGMNSVFKPKKLFENKLEFHCNLVEKKMHFFNSSELFSCSNKTLEK